MPDPKPLLSLNWKRLLAFTTYVFNPGFTTPTVVLEAHFEVLIIFPLHFCL